MESSPHNSQIDDVSPGEADARSHHANNEGVLKGGGVDASFATRDLSTRGHSAPVDHHGYCLVGQNEDKEEDKPYLFEDAIALTGHGRFHYMLLICCGFCLTSVIISTLNTSYLLPSAACDFSMTAQDKGLLNAMCQIGIICSSHFWGYLADTRGRKKIIITGMVMDSFITIISSFSHAYWIFVVFKFFNGFAICASHAVNYAYLGEFHSTPTRTKAIMLCGVFSSVATVTMPGLAWLVIPQTWSFQMPTYTYRTWRVFVVLTAIPGLLTSILYCLFPESPKFLLSQGKEQECIAILRRIYAINTGKSPETYPNTYEN